MSNVAEIVQDGIYDSFTAILRDMGYVDTLVVFANENGLEPRNSYLLVNILDNKHVGRHSSGTFLTEEKEELVTIEFYEICLQLSFIGKHSQNIAWDWDSEVPAQHYTREEFQKRSLGYMRKSNIRRNPQPRESGWSEMFNLDMDLSFSIITRRREDWIEYITFNGEIIKTRESSLP